MENLLADLEVRRKALEERVEKTASAIGYAADIVNGNNDKMDKISSSLNALEKVLTRVEEEAKKIEELSELFVRWCTFLTAVFTAFRTWMLRYRFKPA